MRARGEGKYSLLVGRMSEGNTKVTLQRSGRRIGCTDVVVGFRIGRGSAGKFSKARAADYIVETAPRMSIEQVECVKADVHDQTFRDQGETLSGLYILVFLREEAGTTQEPGRIAKGVIRRLGKGPRIQLGALSEDVFPSVETVDVAVDEIGNNRRSGC
jgi:hypothetical protein